MDSTLKLIDTHCHLNDVEAFPNPEEVLARAIQSGVDRLIVVGVDEETSVKAVELADDHANVFAAVGWHPNYASKYSTKKLQVLEPLLQHPKTVALGEIGLDFHWDFATLEQQEACLRDQIELSRELNKPLIFHCREAHDALLAILERQQLERFVLHCFAGTNADAARAVALGAYFGVDGPITYKKADELREIIKELPRDRIVIETDSPWLAPHPFRGKTNEPANLVLVNRALAGCLEIEESDSAALTTGNAERLFWASD